MPALLPMSQSLSPSTCESAYSLAFHPVYRYSLFLQFIILITAVLPLTYFLWVKLRKSSFHGNLKWLLGGYFGSILGFTVLLLVLATAQILLPSFSTSKCDVIFSEKYYRLSSFSVAFFMSLPTFFPIFITIERFFATKLAEKYDKKRVLLGPVMTVFVIFLDFLIILDFFKDETFDGGAVNLMFYPATVAPSIYALLWVLIALNIIDIFFNYLLLRQNSKFKKLNSSLSAKYQLEEVYFSTVFSISVMSLHIVLYGVYVSLIMFWRYWGQIIISNPEDLPAVRGATVTTVEICNLVIGSVAVHLYRELRKKKSNELSGNVGMQATGRAGVRNYEDAINNIWNSHSRNSF